MPTVDNPDVRFVERVEHKKQIEDSDGNVSTITLWNTNEEVLPIEIEIFINDDISDTTGNATLDTLKGILDNIAKFWYYAGTVETRDDDGATDNLHHLRAYFNPSFFINFDGSNGTFDENFSSIVSKILDDGVSVIFIRYQGQMRRVELINAG